MKTTISVLIAITINMLFFASNVSAKPSELQTAREFFDNYVEHFNGFLKDPSDTKSLNASASDISYPSVWVAPKGQKLIATDEAFVIKNTRGFIEYLRKQGVTRIEWEIVDMKQLGSKVIIASNTARLLKADGQLLTKSSGTYLLYKEDSGWRLFSRIQHTSQDRIDFQ